MIREKEKAVDAIHVAIARRMRQRNMSWHYIGQRLGFPSEVIRRAADPVWAAKRREQINSARRRTYISSKKPHQVADTGQLIGRNPRFDPRRDGSPIYRTPYSEMLGEPPVGRSALDQKLRSMGAGT